MKKVKLFGKAISKKLFVVLLAISVATVAAAGYVVWQHHVDIEVDEPFQVTTSKPLPIQMNVYPGAVWTFDITVSNPLSEYDYTATLVYSVNADAGVKYIITPESGTSQTVTAGGSVTFTVTVEIPKDSAPGTLSITWKILRG